MHMQDANGITKQNKLLEFFKQVDVVDEKEQDENESIQSVIVSELTGHNIRATVTYTRGDSPIFGFIYKLGKEDTCFSGTSGELAYRLITVLTSKDITVPKNCTKTKIFENIQEQALLLFKGTFFAPWLLGFKCKTIKAKAFENLKRYNSKNIDMNTENSVWVSTDASVAGIGKCPYPSSSTDEFVIIPTSQYPNAPIILQSLVFLSKYQDGFITYNTYSDLRFGAFDPMLTNEIVDTLSKTNSVLKGFPAESPAEFLFNLSQKDRKMKIDSRVLQYIIFEYKVEGCDEMMIEWGLSGSIDFSDKVIYSLVELDPFHAHILFGPPLHILEPFPDLIELKLHDVIRFSNGNFLQMPITMSKSGTTDELLNKYFPGLHQKIINASKANAAPKYPKKTYGIRTKV